MLPLRRRSRRIEPSTKPIYNRNTGLEVSTVERISKRPPLPELLLEVGEDDEADGDPGEAARDVGQVREGRHGGGGGVITPVHCHPHLWRWLVCR